jgi:hypothetical protein
MYSIATHLSIHAPVHAPVVRLSCVVRLLRLVAVAMQGVLRLVRAFRKRQFHVIAGVVAWCSMVLFRVIASAMLVTILERNSGGSTPSVIGQKIHSS